MASHVPILEICCVCQHVHDTRESAFERWITQQAYREEIGIDPTDCPLTHTYCPPCYAFVMSQIRAA